MIVYFFAISLLFVVGFWIFGYSLSFFFSIFFFCYLLLWCISVLLYAVIISEITVRSRAHDVQEDWKPAFLSNEEFTYLVLEALEGFVMVFSVNGRIYYVSEGITSLLGHNPVCRLHNILFRFTLWFFIILTFCYNVKLTLFSNF